MNSHKIKVYLVGGAVRDQVLGRESKDLDFVVVGATRGYMECLGFDQVGADFPVFLHPKTKDEFALARTERKTEKGYHGFKCDFNIDITLEDDLVRRDLTMNSMAIEVNADILETGVMEFIGEIVDPYHGQVDALAGVLRHTSEAFKEDPLRVLRTCRFAARYNFTIALETVNEMATIVNTGEMDALPMERVFAEFHKAMMEDHPEMFFHYMNITGACDLYFSEITDWNNTGLAFAISIGATFEERVALLCSGMSTTDVKRMLGGIKAPNHVLDVVVWFCHLETLTEGVQFEFLENKIEALWKDINRINGWRSVEKIQNVAHLLLYCNGGTEVFNAVRVVMAAIKAAARVGFDDLDPTTRDSLVGKEIGEAISQKRLDVIQELNLFPS